jgi:hypothetical protein
LAALVKHLKVDASPPQQAALQFLGTPILMGVAILLLTSFLQNLVTGGPAARFPVHLFRFAMITVFLSAGANSMLNAFFWPQRSQSQDGQKVRYHFLAILPSLILLVLGVILLMRFFAFY